jgi:two-component system response regulator MprA
MGMARVLIVDDDRGIRELLTCALEFEGYDVATLTDGTRVRDVLAEQAEPCIVLMDLMMPRVDGWAVCRALEAEPALLARHTLVLMTAATLPDGTCPPPARAVLRKPFDLDALYRLVSTLSARPCGSESGCRPTALAS